MIEFPPEIPNFKLLRKAVKVARKNRNPFPTLNVLAPNGSHEELTGLARKWQNLGLGSVTEARVDGEWSVSFTLNEDALKLVDSLNAKTFFGKLKSIPLGTHLWEVAKLSLAAIFGAVAQSYFGS